MNDHAESDDPYLGASARSNSLQEAEVQIKAVAHTICNRVKDLTRHLFRSIGKSFYYPLMNLLLIKSVSFTLRS